MIKTTNKLKKHLKIEKAIKIHYPACFTLNRSCVCINKMNKNKKEIKIPKPKFIKRYKKNLYRTKKVQKLLKEIMPEYYE